MSGRWEDTMKTPTMWRSKYTARGYEEPHSDEGCFAADKGHSYALGKMSRQTWSGTRSLCGRLHTSFPQR